MPRFLRLGPSPLSKAPIIFRLFQFTLCGPCWRDHRAKRFVFSLQPTKEKQGLPRSGGDNSSALARASQVLNSNFSSIGRGRAGPHVNTRTVGQQGNLLYLQPPVKIALRG